MEKRRTGSWFLASAVLSGPAWPCTVPADWTRIESTRYVVAYKAEAVEVAKHFSVDVATCPKSNRPPAEALKVDAQMPEHRHGMNYRTVVKEAGDGRYVAEGLMFHMPGRWELVFEVRGDGRTDRMTRSIVLE